MHHKGRGENGKFYFFAIRACTSALVESSVQGIPQQVWNQARSCCKPATPTSASWWHVATTSLTEPLVESPWNLQLQVLRKQKEYSVSNLEVAPKQKKEQMMVYGVQKTKLKYRLWWAGKRVPSSVKREIKWYNLLGSSRPVLEMMKINTVLRGFKHEPGAVSMALGILTMRTISVKQIPLLSFLSNRYWSKERLSNMSKSPST